MTSTPSGSAEGSARLSLDMSNDINDISGRVISGRMRTALQLDYSRRSVTGTERHGAVAAEAMDRIDVLILKSSW